MASMERHRGKLVVFWRWGLAAFLAGPFIWACPQTAGAQSFVFGQITNTTGATFSANAEPSLSASGTRIAFSSDRNLVNPVGCPVLPDNAGATRQIYLFDTTTGCYTQVTAGPSPFTSSSAPSLDAAGTRVAFASRANLVNPGGCPALPGNADTSGEIYLFDFTSGCYIQVTDTPPAPGFGNTLPSLSGGGARVAFSSDLNLVNPGGCPVLPGNADGNIEIYVFDTTTACYVQVTNTTGGGLSGGNLFASLNADGTRVAFHSDRNLVNPGGCPILPGNADGNREVYLFDTTTGCYVQVTTTTGGTNGNALPRLSAAGTRVVFQSDRNLVNPGGCPVLPGNADGNREIYMFDTTTGCYIQVTNGSGPFSLSPSLDAAGIRIVFQSSLDLVNPVGCPVLPGNADLNAEFYLFDTSTGCYTQVTNTTGPIGPIVGLFPAISGDGTRIAFASGQDTTQLSPCPGCPGNSDGNLEIFLASSAPAGVTSIPTLSEWTRLAMVVILIMGAFLSLRRRPVR